MSQIKRSKTTKYNPLYENKQFERENNAMETTKILEKQLEGQEITLLTKYHYNSFLSFIRQKSLFKVKFLFYFLN